jgi:MtrB/PioB family decaheme-associated outer membrane protein
MNIPSRYRRSAIALALLGIALPAPGTEPEVTPGLQNAARVGLGHADTDGRRFGQYSGLHEDGFYGLFDFHLVRRDDATGRWLKFYGRDLGLDSRHLRFDHSRQGNWGYFVEYSRIPRHEPYVAVTAVQGITTPNLTVPAATTAGTPLDLKTRRDALGLGFSKLLTKEWDIRVTFRNEEKDGARLFARGTPGGGVVGGPIFGTFEFAPEPINSTTRQLEAVIGYTGERLQLSGGYYGTLFNNQYNGINFTGGAAGLAAFNPIALPPDNSSHQLYLTGGFAFTPTTRGTFKLSRASAKQDDTFVPVAVAPGIGRNLQGKVDTTLAQAGISSRPTPKLTLRADLRYEDRDDKTPVLQYFPGATGTYDGRNEPRSIRTARGLIEASYLLPNSFRVTGGIEKEEKKRNTSVFRSVSFRETTDELSYRVELRRSMSETVTGAVSYVYSDRDGSPFYRNIQTTGAVGSNLIAPIHLADRERHKVRLSVNWTPSDPLSVQFFVDEARDNYSGRDGSALGPRKGEARNYSLDAAYRFSDRWQANAWYNWNDTRARQATCESASATGVCPNTNADPLWQADLRNRSDSIGAGLRGKPTGRLEVGADLSLSDIKDSYLQQTLSPATSTVPTALPEITTRLTRLNFFGRYALEKGSGIRLDYIHDRYSTNDWTWTTWQYLDGTRLIEPRPQRVNFFGISYYHRWQ